MVDGSELARVLDDSSDDISDAVRIMIDFIVAGAHEGPHELLIVAIYWVWIDCVAY